MRGKSPWLQAPRNFLPDPLVQESGGMPEAVPTTLRARATRIGGRARRPDPRQWGGDSLKSITRSHQAAAASSRASAQGAPVSCTANGKPSCARPVGREMDGMPAELHGAQKYGSPVDSRPFGAGPAAVGETRAS